MYPNNFAFGCGFYMSLVVDLDVVGLGGRGCLWFQSRFGCWWCGFCVRLWIAKD